MKILEVKNDPFLTKSFLDLPNKIYEDYPNWTPQLGVDIEHVFDTDKNSLLRNGEARRWMICNEWNITVGRIAAFYNGERDKELGGFGFFECVNEPGIAKGLFDCARKWLKGKGCSVMLGPINFGEKDRFWGILSSGFDAPSVYLDNYNPPYYEGLFRDAGFNEEDDILTYTIPLKELPVKLTERAAKRLLERDEIHFKKFDFSNLNDQVTDLHKIYIEGFKEEKRIKHITEKDIYELIKLNRQVLDEKTFWLAYKGTEPIGVSLYMKDMNQNLRAITGAEMKKETNLKSVAFAVVPQYRERGVELGLLFHLFNSLANENNDYKIIFCGVNSNSYKITSLMEKIGCSVEKVHKTFTLNI